MTIEKAVNNFLKNNKDKHLQEQINDPARSDFFKILNKKIDEIIEEGEEILVSSIGYSLHHLKFIISTHRPQIYLISQGFNAILISDKLLYHPAKGINEIGIIIDKIQLFYIDKIQLFYKEQEEKKEKKKEEEKQVVKTDDDIINEFFNL
jgi:hypothetical protein